MRRFHFLADVHEIVDGAKLAARAQRAEQMGYHSLVPPDHLLGQLSPVATMATVAAATSTLRVSAFVMNNDLRHPTVLAQDLASIDVLSGGRLDVAIGAGWNKPEYDAVGMRFDPTPVQRPHPPFFARSRSAHPQSGRSGSGHRRVGASHTAERHRRCCVADVGGHSREDRLGA
jgi:hypothetical protein